MLASRARELPSKISKNIPFASHEVTRLRSFAGRPGQKFWRQAFSRSTSSGSRKKNSDDEKPKRIYLHELDKDLLNLGGITEEMLAKKHRISSSISQEETTFTTEMIKGLNRKDLQKLCKAIGVSQAAKSSILVEKIIDYLDTNGLSGLTFHPFCNPNKPSSLAPGDMDPLSIELDSRYTAPYGRIYQGRFPSVTTVLKHTKPELDATRLENWEKKEINRIGKDKFDKMMQNTLDNGKQLHKTVAEWLTEAHMLEKKEKLAFNNDLGLLQTTVSQKNFREDFFKSKLDHLQEINHNSLLSNQLKSMLPVLVKVELVAAIESGVVSDLLSYAGTCDCIAVYEGQLCIFDWKTSKRKKKSLKSCHDYPVQLAAYAGAVNQDSAYSFGVESAAIVFAYEDGSPADVHMLTCNQCEQYFDQWQCRLQVFKNNYEIPTLTEELIEDDDDDADDGYSEDIDSVADRKLIDKCVESGSFEPGFNEILTDSVKMEPEDSDLLIKKAIEIIDNGGNLSSSDIHEVNDFSRQQVTQKHFYKAESVNTAVKIAEKDNYVEEFCPASASEEVCSKTDVGSFGSTISAGPRQELESIKEHAEIFKVPLHLTNADQDMIVEESIDKPILVEDSIDFKISEKIKSAESGSFLKDEQNDIAVGYEHDSKASSRDDIIIREEKSHLIDDKENANNRSEFIANVKTQERFDDKFCKIERSNPDDSVLAENKTHRSAVCSENALHKDNKFSSEKINDDLQDDGKKVNTMCSEKEIPNMTSLKSEYHRNMAKVSKMDRGDSVQFATWYLKRKYDSVKKYITSFWS